MGKHNVYKDDPRNNKYFLSYILPYFENIFLKLFCFELNNVFLYNLCTFAKLGLLSPTTLLRALPLNHNVLFLNVGCFSDFYRRQHDLMSFGAPLCAANSKRR